MEEHHLNLKASEPNEERLVTTPDHVQNNPENNIRNSSIIRRRKDSMLTWNNLGMEVTLKESVGFLKYENKQKTILENLNGYAKSGECLAIIGGSGAGKSSFLNLLSDRVDRDKMTKITGDVKINNQTMNYEKFKHVIGFVMQADIFLEHLTVREYFRFAIDLRESVRTNLEKEELLDNAVTMMKLEKAENNFVGGVFRKGISGGEKKRLNIGFELLGDPSILFLDEPTSGLDSYTSFMIITLLKQIAVENNIVVVYTIHQPSIEIFNLFDNLMILDKGKNIYFGNAQAAIDYYAQMDYAVPMNTNPANHFITIALRGPERNQQFYDHYNSFILPSIKEESAKCDKLEPFENKNKLVGPLTQYMILLVRAFKIFVRNPMSFVIRFVQICFLIIIFCMLYFQMSRDFEKPINIINREGAFFFLSINMFISYFQNYLLTCKLISPRRKRVIFKRIQRRIVWSSPLHHFETHHRASIYSSVFSVFHCDYLLHCWIQSEC